MASSENKRIEFVRQLVLKARYFSLQDSKAQERSLAITDLLLIDSALISEQSLNKQFLTQAVFPWLRRIEENDSGLTSALPFQIVSLFKTLELEENGISDAEMVSTFGDEESKDQNTVEETKS